MNRDNLLPRKIRLRRSVYGRLIKDKQHDEWKVEVSKRKTSFERNITLYDVVIRYQKGFIHDVGLGKRKYYVSEIAKNGVIRLSRYSGEADTSITHVRDSWYELSRQTTLSETIYSNGVGLHAKKNAGRLFIVERKPMEVINYKIIHGSSRVSMLIRRRKINGLFR